ncbi:M20 family metallopeptidase [Brevibacillus borstelensis]|uniref:M20 family metallopeptidase n=1 Tax=Brevibacillus borstelensis TaxID=45462 RepID=UPI001562E91F|nr:M20 family metallopeptidase [Brevibacillus borstelensis]MBE5398161.1 M20 family metallopeptidase [Brevibacillus borstelensis]
MTANWTAYFRDQLPDILEELRRYVEMESPTHNKEAVDRVGAFIADRFRALGCRVDTYPQHEYGDQLRVEYGEGEEQILVLGHFDTVKEIGSLSREPWRIEDGKVYGPGTYDMKAGIVFCYYALEAIIEQKLPLSRKLVFFWNTDEETGSLSSEELIKEEAKRSRCALVIEPAAGDGSLKTSRKGGGEFLLKVKGRAAHAGNDHAKGINAIEELAHHVLTIQSWTNYEAGTTLSVGTIQGGSVSNVVPDYAEAVIDVRVSTAEEAVRITRLMHQLQPVLPGAELIVEGGIPKPPMERTAGTEHLFFHAREQARLEGFDLTETGVGGTSDGNFAASVGTPTLDGLGPNGDGAHASHEHVEIDSIPQKIALLARLFTTL